MRRRFAIGRSRPPTRPTGRSDLNRTKRGVERSFRWAASSDYRALADVMFDAVRNGPSPYSDGQRQTWVPAPRSGPEWSDRLSQQDIIVAETGPRIVGFMSLAAGGYIDFAYIRPEAQHTGLFL